MRAKHLLAAAVLAIAPVFATAGILADLGSMVMSNSTAPSTMSTQDRVGMFMGGFSMRTPIQNVHLLTFDPPRIDAGCGGIDLYGGSFSFINGAQLIQIFRNVAANAAGLAFKAAIKAISPSLDALLSEFQALLQNMNNLSKNSCQLAHLLVDPAENALSNAVNGDGTVSSTQSNAFTDGMASLTGYLSQANSYLKNVSSNSPKQGNQVVKTVISSGASSIMGMAGLTNVDGTSDNPTDPNSLNNQLLYALLGYKINGVPCSSQNQDGTPASTSTPPNNSVGQVMCSGPKLITLDSIFKGGGIGSPYPNAALQLYQCQNPSGSVFGGIDNQPCTIMQTRDFNYQGVQGYVRTMLFGSPDPSQIATSSSIVGEFNGGTSTSFTPQQIQFIHQMGTPLMALLSKTSNPGTRTAIAQRLEPLIEQCVTAQIGEVLYRGANLIQTSTGFDLDKDQKDNIEQLRTDYLRYQNFCNEADSMHKIVGELNDDARLMSTSNR
ncbi:MULTISPECIES: conjugal transfer protein TraH [Paraburkholderia]|uniref:Conjugal transfer protein TraH n=1 Tax=Paraburkholderia madseniana TaxID=2599607 RepID=A0AAP5BLL7_9BURK|nr:MULTISPECIES: conjugal transfer protein TraH [Paraburkholderia]MCX4151028.1 conjugal transfer protein TraH [Paraburkholderia madseniana]MCX4176668.1 conjugal transfer protein TraH [Paraburkholderia madseniana]MDN7153960.1 conjugal transfer protein TraH [Paraburkholderia sp. WS6]MDQ6412842.1 conjugal transfer protein TraH [Paraburkholderia madseniana]MDQ6464659.1 conjugal transfer protein TraH [Paraburkholderia madseniana]